MLDGAKGIRNMGHFLLIANKYCSFCEKFLKKDEIHSNCYKNYEGSSQGMESELALKAVKSVSEKFGLHLTEFVSDGDSSSFKKVRENVEWFVRKLNCINHLLKNSKLRLIELTNQNKL